MSSQEGLRERAEEFARRSPWQVDAQSLEQFAQSETRGSIEWFESLRESIVKDEKEIALASIDSALKMLERENA